MGYLHNQNLWPPPYDFSPPSEVDDSKAHFILFIIAIIVILAISFLIACCFAIIKRYRRKRNNPAGSTTVEPEENLETPRDRGSDDSAIGSTGLDEAVIKTITVCKYQKGDGLIERTECAVCLSEFQENEYLRLLPNCVHAFHLRCIDTWLKSHSSCPLCRVDVNFPYRVAPSVTSTQTHNIASLEVQRPDDLIVVVDDHSQEVVLDLSSDDDDDDDDDDVTPKSP